MLARTDGLPSFMRDIVLSGAATCLAVSFGLLLALASEARGATRHNVIAFKDDPHARSMPVYAPQYSRERHPGPGVHAPKPQRKVKRKQPVRQRVAVDRSVSAPAQWGAAQILPHPPGCPPRAFCGCGAALEVFGRHVRELWLARNWFRFPRAEPAPGMVAVRRSHVFVIRAVHGADLVTAYDANSGGRKTRLHLRSLRGYVVVNPRGSRYATAG